VIKVLKAAEGGGMDRDTTESPSEPLFGSRENLDWRDLQALLGRPITTKRGKKFHVARVLERAVVVAPQGRRAHRVSRTCLEKAVAKINTGVILRGPSDYRREICDDKPSYAWGILKELGHV